MTTLRKIGLGTVIVAVMTVALIGAARQDDVYFLIKKNFTIFSEVYKEVSLHYVDEVDPEKLMRRGINAMLESLDPYTVLLDESDNQNMEIISRGSYGGVGLEVGMRGKNIVVIAPTEGYSAHKKGIRSGDIIIAVGGVSVENLSPEEVQDLTIGDPGSTVTMTIRRYGVEKDLTFELERRRVKVKNIAYSGLVGPERKIGYLSLSRFSQNAAEEIRSEIDRFQTAGGMNGLILDLRNNPGGLLEEAVKTVDKFVEPGLKVVETRGRLNGHNAVFRTEEPAIVSSLPLVVLQNEGSASSSEIVAGALQDLDRAVIVGERSFGKGLVQVVRPLSYNTSLKITTSRYYIPSGRSIQSLMYTHDENNSVTAKADSLRKAFKTRNGRTVYEGEGIAPDIKIKKQQPSLLETELLKESHFFFFANRYASAHKKFNFDTAPAGMFEEFKRYLDESGFDYETRSERYLDEVSKKMKEEEGTPEISRHIEALQEAINREKKEDLEAQQEMLKRKLYLEIVARYRGREGQTEASLKWDPAVNKAVDIIRDERIYKDILAIR